MDCEIVVGDVRPRATALLRGLEASAGAYGVNAQATQRCEGRSELLIVWGAGHPITNKWFKQHVASGRPALCWDMGYWNAGRGNETLGMNRVSLNALHPQGVVLLEQMKADRLNQHPVTFANKWKPDGHVVLVGLGPKTCDQYGLRWSEWERKKLSEIRKALPGRKIVYRPKPGREFSPIPNVETDWISPIDQVLDGASLVVCRHSNVALDAMRNGIPASVEDGVAAAVYGSGFDQKPVDDTTRRQFFQNLAWFQWNVQECWKGEAWPFLKRLVECAYTSAAARST